MRHEAILRPKLTPPPLRRPFVSRLRLDRKFRRALNVPLTLVSAPAGFGKTTATVAAMQALAADTSTPLAWFSVTGRDNVPVRFWRYLFSAVETAVSLPASFANRLTDPQPPPVPALLIALLNQLADQPEEILLALDDLHHIDRPEIHQGLAFLLDHAPPNLHLLLVTRADPPLPLHRLRARGQLLEVRAQDLRFDAAEAGDFLQRVMALSLNDEEATLLTEQTEGWAAGLQLAALALPPDRADRGAFIRRLADNNRYILEYLTEEVLAQQPDPVQTFLLQTAILDRLCGPLCDAVTGRSDGQKILADLARRNLFIHPVTTGATRATAVSWYRYHQLFAALLQGHLRQRMPDQIAALHGRAAAWFAAHDDVEAALDHALSAADYPLATRLLEENANDFVLRGHARLLERWLGRLPEAQLAAMPRANLAFARALLLRGRLHAVTPYLQRAAASELAAQDRGFQGEVHALQATLADTQGDADRALEYARQAIASVPEENRLAQAMAHYALAGALREKGDVAAAVTAYDRTIPLARAARLVLVEMLARAHLGFLCILQGQLRRAAAATRPAVAAAVGHPAAATVYTSLAEVHLAWNQLAEAEQLLQQAMALAGESGHNAAAINCHIVGCRLLLAQGDNAGAQEAIEEAAVLWERGAPAWLEPLLRAQQVKFWLAQGAVATAEQMLSQVDDSAFGYMAATLTLARARVGLHQGTDDSLAAAQSVLDGVLKTAVSQERNGVVLEARLLRALVYAARNERAAAAAELEGALDLAAPEGYVRLFLEAGAPLAHLLAATSHPYARTLLAAFPETIRAEVTAVSPLPEPLTEREADVLRLMAAGLTYRQIAGELVVSVNTVRHHVKGLYSKLSVNSRALAVEKARELGLLS